jgi:sigma-B regulation protein RsbU (phosphoserine phosphatase)
MNLTGQSIMNRFKAASKGCGDEQVSKDATMKMLPDSGVVRDRLRRILRPRTRWGRVALWSGGLSVFLIAVRWLTGSASEPKVSGWAKLFAFVFALCAARIAFRWLRRKIMWRLRHRLIIAYVFAGIIPILLLLMMAGVGSYLCAWQFATYIATSDLGSTLQHLDASNNALAAQLRTLERAGNLNEQSAGEFAAVAGEDFPRRTVTVWQGKNGFLLSADGKPLKTPPGKVPDSIKGNFAGFVLDAGLLHLRAVKRYDEGGLTLTVISNVPVTPELLRSASSRLGTVSLRPLDQRGQLQISPETKEPAASNVVETGRVSPALNRFDQTFHVFSVFNAIEWKTGESQTAVISIVTRPSMLLSTLFAALGDDARILWYVVLAIAVLFGLMELAALYVGIRISRSITLAVAELYDATQHVNRGDLTHRIQIQKRDQMAALEESFNSMTDSLVKLVAEQQQKQRLESELALAYEGPALPPSVNRAGVAGDLWRLPSRALRQRRLLRLHSPQRRRPRAGRGRHQRKRDFGRAPDGHGSCLCPRLLAGFREKGRDSGACRRNIRRGKLPHALRRKRRRPIAAFSGHDDGRAEQSAFSLHPAGEVRNHVPGLL